MTIGTLFTLFVVPSVYVLIAKQHAGEELGAIARDFDEAEDTGHAPPPVAKADEPESGRFDAEPGMPVPADASGRS